MTHVHHAGRSPDEGAAGFLTNLFGTDFVPRAECMLQRPEIIWLHVLSDLLIAGAYFSIPIALVYFVRRRRDLAFHWVFLMFAAFILACGTTHLFGVLAIWHPMYRLDGLVKAFTGVISVVTAVALWPLLPAAIALPSPRQLRAANESLAHEVAERIRAEEGVRRARDELEARVQVRTSELAAANETLREEVARRAIAETASADAENRLRLVVEAARLGTWEADLPSGELVWNQRAREQFGLPPGARVTVETFYGLIFEEDRAMVRAAVDAAIAEQGPFDAEFRAVTPGGELRWLRSMGRAFYDGAGRPRRLEGVVLDFTDRRLQEEELRYHTQLLKTVTDSAASCFILLDRDGRPTYMNPAAEEATGFRLEEIEDRPLHDSIHHHHPDGRPYPRSECPIHRAATSPGGPIAAHEDTYIRRDGTLFPVSCVVAPIERSGETVGAVLEFRDITGERRAAEELATHRDRLAHLVRQRTAELERSHQQLRLSERMASIGTLSAGLGHDMANMLLPIRIRLDSLDESCPSPEVGADVRAIRVAVEHLQRLANGLRLLALDPEEELSPAGGTAPAEWWEDAMPLLRNALPRTVALEADLGPAPPRLRISRHALTQAVFNLVQNAGEAMRAQREGLVRITLAGGPEPGFVRLSVADNGPGMSPEVRARCFEPFFTSKARGLSTGLGLALVHGIARRAGGSVEADSEPGRGSVFTMTLPIAPPEAEQRHGQPAPAARATITLEDDRMRGFVAAVLGSLGYHVEHGPAPGADADLWVVGAPAAEGALREFLARDRRRHAVVFGEAPGLPALDRAVRLAGGAGPAEIRRALRLVAGRAAE